MVLEQLRYTRYFDYVVGRLNSDHEPFALTDLEKLDGISPKLLIDIINAFEDDWCLEFEYFESYSIKEITNYLLITHNYYRNHVLPKIERLIFNLSKDNFSNPLMSRIRSAYSTFKQDFLNHLCQEEQIVFPYVELLFDDDRRVCDVLREINVLSLLRHDHDPPESHSFFRWIKGLRLNCFYETRDFVKLESIVKQFIRDLQVHTFIEEEVLLIKSEILLKAKLKVNDEPLHFICELARL